MKPSLIVLLQHHFIYQELLELKMKLIEIVDKRTNNC